MMRARHIGLAAGLAVVIGASLVGVRKDAWLAPPVPMGSDDLIEASALMAAPFWGGKPDAAVTLAVETEDPRWRVAAVFRSNDGGSVWIEFSAAGKPPQRLGVGDKLPSGHRIVEIGERDVCVAVGRKTLRLGVERAND